MEAQANTTDNDLKTVEIKVKGITCAMEPGNISKSVMKIEGVESCELKGKAKAKSVFVVTYNPDVVSVKQIKDAVCCTASCEDPNKKPYSVIQ